ncbi:MAG: PRC-barrel domain-containing protein [Candidatus Nanosyncoccaceae bacterium]
MLVIGSKALNAPVLSLHVGGEIARTTKAIIDPEDLMVRAYKVAGPIIDNDPEIGDILDTRDVREYSTEGLIIDSSDRFVNQEDVIRIDEIMKLNFDLIGLKVVTAKGKKIGKVVDYTLDSNTFMIYQIIVQRPFMESFIDPQLTINRSQITEIDDYKITIKHDKQQVKVPEKPKEKASEEFEPNYTNPFRKPDYAHSEDSVDDNSSSMSE